AWIAAFCPAGPVPITAQSKCLMIRAAPRMWLRRSRGHHNIFRGECPVLATAKRRTTTPRGRMTDDGGQWAEDQRRTDELIPRPPPRSRGIVAYHDWSPSFVIRHRPCVLGDPPFG